MKLLEVDEKFRLLEWLETFLLMRQRRRHFCNSAATATFHSLS